MVLLDTDYYGNKGAVLKDDGELSIYMIDKEGNSQQVLASYSNAHLKPTTVHWGHPRFNPNLLSAGLDGVLNVYSYDTNTGVWGPCEKLATIHDGILDAKFSPDKFGLNICCLTFQDLVIYSFDEVQQVWISIRKEKISKLGNACLAWDPQKSRIAVAGRGGNVSIFSINLDTKQIVLLKELHSSDHCYKTILWSSDLLLAMSEEGQLVCWQEVGSHGEESSWKPRKMPEGFQSTDSLLSFDPLGKVAIISADNSIKQLKIGVEEVYIIPA